MPALSYALTVKLWTPWVRISLVSENTPSEATRASSLLFSTSMYLSIPLTSLPSTSSFALTVMVTGDVARVSALRVLSAAMFFVTDLITGGVVSIQYS